MTDLKGLGMSELIKLHNELAEKKGRNPETSFKNLAAARAAIQSLETAMTEQAQAPFEGATPIADAPAAEANPDNSKYNSSGKRGPNQGVGAYAKELIVAGKTNAEALALVKAKFPDAKTTTGCIAFYRTALSKGPVGKSPEVLRAEAQALLAKADAAEAAAKAKAEADAAATVKAVSEVPATV